MSELPAASQRVQSSAESLGLAIAIRIMPDSARTATEAAAACGCLVDQIVKSLIFKTKHKGEPLLLLVSGRNRVNENSVAAHVGDTLERADAAFVREVTGFAIGGIPPFGHAQKLTTWMDRDLLFHDVVWAAAGTPHAVFPIAPAILRDVTGARVIAVT